MADKPVLNKEKLLKEIQICCFNINEVVLYLDTHKTDKEALAYFNKHNMMLKELKAEYAKNFGPLSVADNTSTTSWAWTDAPWPWEI